MRQQTRLTLFAALVALASFILTSRATAQPVTPPATGPATAPSQFTLNFKDVPIDAVLDYFSQTLGFEILKDGPIDARVTLMSKQPVTAEEAMTMLSAALQVNGFAVIHQGRMLEIGSRDKARKQNVPVHFGNNPDDVADSGELITQVIPIENVSAKKLADDLKPLVEQDAVTANEGSNSIIVTDTSSNVRRLVEIIAQLDAHEATTTELRMVQLKHANASATAKLLETLFKAGQAQDQQSQQNPGMPRGMPQQPNQGGPPSEGGSERHGQTVVVTADDRTNSLLIMASAGTLKVIDGIIQQLDTDNPNPAPPANVRFFPLKFAAADATAKLINNLFKPTSNNNNGILALIYGQDFGNNEDEKKVNVNADYDERTNTVIVTGPPEKLKDVEVLIRQLDTSPMVSQDLRVMRLQYADAAVVAKLIEDMFEPKKEDDTSNGPFRLVFISPVPAEQQVRGLKINVTSDERTNTVLVSAPTPVLDSIENVVRQLDANPATEDTVFIYHLRNGQAQHLGYTLNVLFGNIATPNQNNEQNGQNQPNFPGQQGQFGENQPGGRQPAPPPSTGNRSASNNRNSQSGRLGIPGVSAALAPAVNELTGKVFIVPEPDTNALLVTTASKYEPVVRSIIEDLDKPVRQVLIKVLVAEVTHDNGDQFGVDFSVLNERQTSNHPELTSSTIVTSPINSSTTSGPNGTTSTTSGGSTVTNNYTSSAITNGSSLGSTLGAAAAAAATPNGLVYSLLEHNVTATIQALETEGKLDVLSRPYILTSDNQEATIVIGEEDPFVSDTRVETTGQLVNTIEYQQIGVILDVTPHVNPDGLVVMDVNPQVSEKEPGGVTITQGVVSPIYSTRTASAHVAIPNGATIVIGGMMQDEVTSQVNKVPLLGDLPLVGALFQNSSQQKTKTELLFFLTPHVAQLPDDLQAMSNDEQKGTKLVPNAVGPGIFDEHMRGMRLGQPAQTQPTQPSSPLMNIPLN
ncbi:MAG: secretin N-terminal domain-containing protein [Tepidisphaeraceae bacterium]